VTFKEVNMTRQLLVTCTAAAMLAACGGGLQTPSALTPGNPVGSSAVKQRVIPAPVIKNVAAAPNLGKSWISPDAKNAPRLLFISDYGASDVLIFTMPAMALKGVLTGFSYPEGECSDRLGNIWIANAGALQILEYSRTGTLLKTLSDAYGFPASCAFDQHGNLAVANIESSTAGAGNIVVYANATGSGTVYTNPSFFQYFFVGYDPNGNLFFDGTNSSRTSSYLAELPAGSSNTKLISLSGGTLHLAGFVQWYRSGNYLALGDQTCGANFTCVYWVTISGSAGTITGTTSLGDFEDYEVCDLAQGVIAAYGERYLAGADYEAPCGFAPTTADRWPWDGGGVPTNYNNPAYYVEPIGAAVSTK
jgi:hypothetical protein